MVRVAFSLTPKSLRTPHAQLDAHHDMGGEGGAMEETLNLRIASIFIVAVVSLLGTLLAVLLERHMGKTQGGDTNTNPKNGQFKAIPQRLLKCLAAGVIASVGFVHVLAESAESLGELSPFPWAHVVAMLGAFLTLMLNQVHKHRL